MQIYSRIVIVLFAALWTERVFGEEIAKEKGIFIITSNNLVDYLSHCESEKIATMIAFTACTLYVYIYI